MPSHQICLGGNGKLRDLVVLVPGWSCPKSYEWDISPFASWFKEIGMDVIRFRQLENGMCSIDNNAAVLNDIIDQQFRANPYGRKIHVIGHSMGGLTARKAARNSAALFTTLTTIATPHKGTQLARAGFWSQSARQMVPGSDWLQRLEEKEKIYNYYWPPILNVACRLDEVVPHNNSFMEDAKQRVSVNHTHLSVIFSRRVWQTIAKFITKGYNELGES